MDALAGFLLAVVGLAIFALVMFLVIRAAATAAIRRTIELGQIHSLLATQADLTARLAKHLTAQSDLMLATSRYQGMTDAELAPIVQQLEERKADAKFELPFS